MKTETTPFNPFDYLETGEEIAEFLTNALMDDDPRVFVSALGHMIKHHGVAGVAEKTGLNRESLYKVLSGNNQPKWDTIQRILKALEIQLKVAA